jgi:hypothetical protein
LDLANGDKIGVSSLNPILFAVKCRSVDVLTYLVSEFGLRQSVGTHRVTVSNDGY